MKLGNPDIVPWLLLLIPILGLIIFFLAQRIKALSHLGNPTIVRILVNSISKKKIMIKGCLLFLAFAMLGVAMINPQIGTKLKNVKKKGIEIVLAMDISNSMEAQDFNPSRLEYAKYKLTELVNQLGGNKIGLVIFAGSAFRQCPMTLDHRALKLFIRIASSDAIQTQGTNFAAAITKAQETLNEGTGDSQEGKKESKIIIIVSDGENNEGGLKKAIEKAKENDIKIFTVGIGSAQGSPIPILDKAGNIKGYKRDQNGETITTAFSGKSLTRISQETGGKFYQIAEYGSNFNNIIEDLVDLDKTEFESKTLVDFDDKFQIFLTISLFLLTIESIIGDKKRHKQV